jgi:hypothetical protein
MKQQKIYFRLLFFPSSAQNSSNSSKQFRSVPGGELRQDKLFIRSFFSAVVLLSAALCCFPLINERQFILFTKNISVMEA